VNADTPAKKNWAYIFSPCVIIAIIFMGMLIYAFDPIVPGEERGNLAYVLVLLLPCFLVLLLIDIIVRICLKNAKRKALYVWGIEVALLVLFSSISYCNYIFRY